MFGYVQSRKSSEWIQKVNKWIMGESVKSINLEIDWKSRDERLVAITIFEDVEKLKSLHTRKQSNDTILLWHYFINLC